MRPTGPTRRAAASSLSTFLQWVNPHLHQGAGPPLPLPFRGPYGLGLRAPPPPGNHQGRGSDRPPCYKAGETLLTIPVALWGPVSADFALEQATTYAPHIHDALGSAGRGLVTPMALALHLGLALLDETDPIHPYVRFLYQSSQEDDPGASSPHPLLLGGDALRGLFQASPVVPALEKRQRIYASIHQQLFPQPGPPPALPFPVFLWAVSRILSRAISGPGRPLTLVPYFDLLNHSAYFNCDYEVSFGPERCDVVVHATRDVR